MLNLDGVFLDLRPSVLLPINLLARGFTAARWTSGRSARPPIACPSRGARPPSPPAAALAPEIVYNLT